MCKVNLHFKNCKTLILYTWIEDLRMQTSCTAPLMPHENDDLQKYSYPLTLTELKAKILVT